MMKIPANIKLAGHTIKIKFADTAHSSSSGRYNNYHNLIALESEKDTPEDNISEAFLHEIIEAIKAKNNLDLDHVALTVLSESLFQVIRDNNLDFRP
jgi:hypothetical protein